MSAIKPGDLVMIVRPLFCCGFSGSLGSVATVTEPFDRTPYIRCRQCGDLSENTDEYVRLNCGGYSERRRLKKIDPPETGDSLPTRSDLNIPEPACP